MSKIIYLASPYTHKDKEIMELRFKQISKTSVGLTKEGKIAFSPITSGKGTKFLYELDAR